MIIWGTFAVPNDPSRSGEAPVVTSGIIRLAIEIGIFVFAIWALIECEYFKPALILCLALIVHYIVSYDRIIWLISQ